MRVPENRIKARFAGISEPTDFSFSVGSPYPPCSTADNNTTPCMFEQTFKNIDDILHKDAGCTSELDYTELAPSI